MIGFKIIDYQEVSSTNEVLKELFREGRADEGTVILADFQTEGKGRGNNSWISDPEANLLISLLLKPDLKASSHFMLTEFVSLSIIEALSKFDTEAKIKWPNDIYLQGKKLAGILIENVIANSRITSSIVGIGLNLNQKNFPEDLPNPVSLNSLREEPVQRSKLLEVILAGIQVRFEQVIENDFQALHKAYLGHIYLLGKKIVYRLNNQDKMGVLADIKPGGEIVIEDDQGKSQEYLFGEITLIN